MRIEDEIRQKAFPNEFVKLHVNLLYTTSWATLKIQQAIRPHGISLQQFNVLRILKGSHPEPLPMKDITARMIDKMSNSSRLVDKLCLKNLAVRQPSRLDSRKVLVQITPKGLDLIKTASETMDRVVGETYNCLSEAETASLNLLLDKLRG
jgi:DNA-binding MarR family transcriptional regulator